MAETEETKKDKRFFKQLVHSNLWMEERPDWAKLF
jgi:hypothetical protein